MRRRLAMFAAGLLTGILAMSGLTAAVATPTDPCAQYVNTSGNSVSGYENYRYLDCRLDRIEAKVGSLPSTSPSPSSTPSATPTPTRTPSASPTPSSSPTASPSTPPTGAACDPSKAVVTFNQNGSRGFGRGDSASTGNGYDVSAEFFGASNYRNTMPVCSPSSWYADIVSVNNASNPGAVQAYPSSRLIYHDWGTSSFANDPRLSTFPKLKAEFGFKDPGACTGCIYDVAFDIWLNSIGNNPQSTELMIWTHNVGQRPYGDKVASGIRVDGHTWDLWSGGNNGVISYVVTDVPEIASGTVDVKAFIADVVARNRINNNSTGADRTDPKVSQISFGVEPVSTGTGSNPPARRFELTQFHVIDR